MDKKSDKQGSFESKTDQPSSEKQVSPKDKHRLKLILRFSAVVAVGATLGALLVVSLSGRPLEAVRKVIERVFHYLSYREAATRKSGFWDLRSRR